MKKHSIIQNVPNLYKLQEEDDDIKNGIINRPKHGKNKNLIKTSDFIGEFNMLYYQPMLNKYAYHRMLLCLLEKKLQEFNKIICF